jgi:hypothetical protein
VDTLILKLLNVGSDEALAMEKKRHVEKAEISHQLYSCRKKI